MSDTKRDPYLPKGMLDPSRDVYPSQYVRRPRSQRPIIEKGKRLSIDEIKGLRLLSPGKHRYDFKEPPFSVTTVISDEHASVGLHTPWTLTIIELASRPLGSGLTWYFYLRDRKKLCRYLYLDPRTGRYVPREHLGLVYRSQYQSPAQRLLMRLRVLVRAIEGDEGRQIGRARGASRRRKLAELKAAHAWLACNRVHADKIIERFPFFEKLMTIAWSLLDGEKQKARERERLRKLKNELKKTREGRKKPS